ncbi:hypothetical protein [Leifsonia xyli]|uniref:hypothetical protein n=1 Tax=Leifsonia xyli TaxID=1575 RepID=UPI003D66FA0B
MHAVAPTSAAQAAQTAPAMSTTSGMPSAHAATLISRSDGTATTGTCDGMSGTGKSMSDTLCMLALLTTTVPGPLATLGISRSEAVQGPHRSRYSRQLRLPHLEVGRPCTFSPSVEPESGDAVHHVGEPSGPDHGRR